MAGPGTACAMFLRGPTVLAESSRTLMLVWILAVAKNVSDEESESKEMGMLLSLQGCNQNSCHSKSTYLSLKFPCAGFPRL